MVCPAFLQNIQTDLGLAGSLLQKKLDGTDDGMLLYSFSVSVGTFPKISVSGEIETENDQQALISSVRLSAHRML